MKGLRCHGRNKHGSSRYKDPTGKSSAVVCQEHKTEGMTSCRSKMCEHSGCEKRPSIEFRLENKKRFCFRHAEDGMINLLLKVCAHSGCTSTANYGHGG
ncbi:unnamed protein product, partial [Pylaiella littoralis]